MRVCSVRGQGRICHSPSSVVSISSRSPSKRPIEWPTPVGRKSSGVRSAVEEDAPHLHLELGEHDEPRFGLHDLDGIGDRRQHHARHARRHAVRAGLGDRCVLRGERIECCLPGGGVAWCVAAAIGVLDGERHPHAREVGMCRCCGLRCRGRCRCRGAGGDERRERDEDANRARVHARILATHESPQARRDRYQCVPECSDTPVRLHRASSVSARVSMPCLQRSAPRRARRRGPARDRGAATVTAARARA
jgi:hypothetical protein